MTKRKNKSLRSELSTYTAKICAFMECGKIDDARQWAAIMQSKLIEMNLLVDTRQSSVYDGTSTENTNTTNGEALCAVKKRNN